MLICSNSSCPPWNAGALPMSILSLTSNDSKKSRSAKQTGTSPDSWLIPALKLSNAGTSHRDSGIVPVSWQLWRFNRRSSINCPNSSGIVLPDRSLPTRFKTSKPIRSTIPGGITPTALLFPKLTSPTTFGLKHRIPNHGVPSSIPHGSQSSNHGLSLFIVFVQLSPSRSSYKASRPWISGWAQEQSPLLRTQKVSHPSFEIKLFTPSSTLPSKSKNCTLSHNPRNSIGKHPPISLFDPFSVKREV